MEDIGNSLGKFNKISKQTRIQRYTAYARICVYMELTKELLDAIQMTWDDEDWMQAIDYEKNHFGCRICHEYGHLFRDFPMNHPNTTTGKE